MSGDVGRGERSRVDEGGRAAQARVVAEGDGEDLGVAGLTHDLVLAQAIPQGRDEEMPDDRDLAPHVDPPRVDRLDDRGEPAAQEEPRLADRLEGAVLAVACLPTWELSPK